jgi:hypothetical protein
MANIFKIVGSPGKLGAAFPAIEGIVGLGAIIATILGFLNPVITFFEIIVTIAKFALFLAMLPLMFIVFIVDLLINAVKSVIDTIVNFIESFKGLHLHAGLSQYKFTGKVGHFGTAVTDFFAAGLPGLPPDPSQTVYGIFLVASNTSSLSGLQQLFGPAPDMPADIPAGPDAPNALNGDKDHKCATLTFAGPGHIVGNWTNARNVPAHYRLAVHDLTAELPAIPPAGTIPVPVALGQHTLPDHTVVKEYDVLVSQAGTTHQYMFPDPVDPLLVGHKYVMVVTLVDDAGVAVPPTGDAINPQTSDPVTYELAPGMPPRPTPAAPGPLVVPDTAEITFQGREGFDVALPGLGFLADEIVQLEQPIKDFEKLIVDTLGRFKIQYKAIQDMIDFWTKQIDDLHKSVTMLQNLVAKFGVFTVHFGGALEVGTIWLYHYEGTIGGMGATMAPILAAGLEGSPDGTGPDQVIQCEFILGEDDFNKTLLKFLTLGH